MGLYLRSGNCRLDIATWLAGCNIHIIFELHVHRGLRYAEVILREALGIRQLLVALQHETVIQVLPTQYGPRHHLARPGTYEYSA